MGLVDYSDSDDDPDDNARIPPAKKRRLSGSGTPSTLPPLPAAFRDLYSSTVRTSTQDDPSLHAGRKRVIPHVAGNWPTHVYLEWSPSKSELQLLANLVTQVRQSFTAAGADEAANALRSLLGNDLGVPLPLHVSLSRPLALKTDQKDPFLPQLWAAVAATSVRTFTVRPLDLMWHANQDRTRWFLVLRLRRPEGDELRNLLKACNDLANWFKQPLLYHPDQESTAKSMRQSDGPAHDSFHISIAWSLHPHGAEEYKQTGTMEQALPTESLDALGKLEIPFNEVKVRIGQDVNSHALPKPRIKKGVDSSTQEAGK